MSTPGALEDGYHDASADGPSGDELAEEPTLDDLMRAVFGLQPHAYRTYLALLSEPGSTAAELGERLDRDRSNVNRSLRSLLERDLADRRRALLESGGHVYRYTAAPLPEVRDRMHTALTAWAAAGHDRLDEFGESIDATTGTAAPVAPFADGGD